MHMCSKFNFLLLLYLNQVHSYWAPIETFGVFFQPGFKGTACEECKENLYGPTCNNGKKPVPFYSAEGLIDLFCFFWCWYHALTALCAIVCSCKNGVCDGGMKGTGGCTCLSGYTGIDCDRRKALDYYSGWCTHVTLDIKAPWVNVFFSLQRSQHVLLCSVGLILVVLRTCPQGSLCADANLVIKVMESNVHVSTAPANKGF